MGSPDSETGRDGDEVQHSVILTRDLFVGVTEVTQSEWIRFMEYNPSQFSNCGGLCPVERVSWFEAVEFANARSRAEDLQECYALSNCRGSLSAGDYRCRTVQVTGAVCEGYRLPTEAEWEYVARAGSTDARYGSLNAIAWYDPSSGGRTHPVGGLAANAWGLHDVMGNVWEWTDDWFAPYGAATINPEGPERGFSKVYRGGSWDYGHRVIRSAYRGIDEPHVRAPDVGVRLVRTVLVSAGP
jgi:formylglycine-generating enzyme required for sulfatase activity